MNRLYRLLLAGLAAPMVGPRTDDPLQKVFLLSCMISSQHGGNAMNNIVIRASLSPDCSATASPPYPVFLLGAALARLSLAQAPPWSASGAPHTSTGVSAKTRRLG